MEGRKCYAQKQSNMRGWCFEILDREQEREKEGGTQNTLSADTYIFGRYSALEMNRKEECVSKKQ